MTLSQAKLNPIWTELPLSTHVWWLGNPKHKAEVLPVHIRCTTLLQKQLFNCIWQIITNEWWIWIVLFIPHCYKTSFSWGLFLCIWDFCRSRNRTGSGSSGIHGEFAPKGWVVKTLSDIRFQMGDDTFMIVTLHNHQTSLVTRMRIIDRLRRIETTRIAAKPLL